jgi:formylglycine-generating enzyme required for sulfatase activity/flavodoxin
MILMRILNIFFALFIFQALVVCSAKASDNVSASERGATRNAVGETTDVLVADNFVLIKGGTFEMGSPESEAWRGSDEKQHAVTVSDFYLDSHELTQGAYRALMGKNPSNFSGDQQPVENVSWLDAIAYCNARSEQEGLTPAYVIDGTGVTWNRSADGYRLPTEAEWEYACRAGTNTPFNTENSIGVKEANYYGHYPYQIEENYFKQGNLATKPGEYRARTTEVGSFSANKFGLYDMHGNVGEWVWDYYGDYGPSGQTDPTGPSAGAFHVYRGGAWNDFAKNLRSAYRATLAGDKSMINIGFRLARNAVKGSGSVTDKATPPPTSTSKNGKVLIAFYSWGGNTKGIAEEIQRQTGADVFEIEPVSPYSNNYNTVLEEAQRDQHKQARPKIKGQVSDMEQYQTVMLGYPNWWASIPMPIATFLEQYDFSGKTIIPFCSHGGGRLGQSLSAIAKLAPKAVMGDALSISYSGGFSLVADIAKWLKTNNIKAN